MRVVLFVLGLVLLCAPVEAGMGEKKGKRGKNMREAKAPYSYFEEKGLFETGLQAVFPAGLTCPGVASPYGSKTRYDGSMRNNDHHGYHNGLDISLEPGSALLAMADGTLIHKGAGGQLVGNFIWLQHGPQDTGLPDYVYMRYQHLSEVPDLVLGSRVEKGQIVAKSGFSGTTGGHFGQAGYPHLHMNILIGQSADFMIKGSQIGPKSMHYFDPIGLFVKPALSQLDNHLLQNLADKKVNIAVVRGDEIVPPQSKIVWPLACQ